MVDRQPVEITDTPGYGREDEKTHKHPAFALVSASRVQGGTYLVGSDFMHQHFVTLKVQRAEMHRSLNYDRFHGREELIEVHLSEAQWATMISTMNHGTGTPCTLDWHGGPVPGLSAPRGTNEDFTQEVKDKARSMGAMVAKALKEVEALAGSMSRVKRERITSVLASLEQELWANMPFMVDQFGEHMETVTEHAKVEVEAYMSGAIARAGLAALGEQPPLVLEDAALKQLEPGDQGDCSEYQGLPLGYGVCRNCDRKEDEHAEDVATFYKFEGLPDGAYYGQCGGCGRALVYCVPKRDGTRGCQGEEESHG